MNLTIKHLRLNEHTHCDDVVPEGTQYGFWRIVEQTGAGWFPWPALYVEKEGAKAAMDRAIAKEVRGCGHGDLCEPTPPPFCPVCGFNLWAYFGLDDEEDDR